MSENEDATGGLVQDTETILESDLTEQSADEIELDDEQVKVAARIMNILDKKNENDEFVYTNMEVRDFVCACVFELGIPMTAQLEAAMYSFMDDVDLEDEENPTEEQLKDGIKKYFEANPLNPELGAEFSALSSEAMRKQGEGYKEGDAGVEAAAKAAAGVAADKRAPQPEPPKGPKPTLKKGLE
jgi:hypothetical protein